MPLNLSQWDQQFMTPEEQTAVSNYKNQYANDPSQRGSVHTFVEGIRSKYGYSGGTDGSQYNPFPVAPTAPTIDKWESPNQGMIDDLFQQIKNPPKYNSEYGDLISQGISDIQNRPKFSYDADTDPAFQAFLARATRAGDKAYADNLGGMSAMTGGRPNSWAGTVASQARNEYTLQAQEAVIHFEDRQYARYKDETADMYNFVNLLNSQDEIAYGRFRDTIGDTKDLFNMVLQLDDRDFENYKFMADQQWKTFDVEYRNYENALQDKKDKVGAALDRTNLTGFVNNEDSILLGVPVGTLSQGARERAEAMEDYVTKQAHDLKQFRAEKEITHEFDMKMFNVREAAAARSGGRSGGGSGGGSDLGEIDANFKPTKAEADHIFKGVAAYEKLVSSDDFRRLTRDEKRNAIGKILDDIVMDVDGEMWGKNSMQIGQAIVARIKSSPEYTQYYANYGREDEIMDEMFSGIPRLDGQPNMMDMIKGLEQKDREDEDYSTKELRKKKKKNNPTTNIPSGLKTL